MTYQFGDILRDPKDGMLVQVIAVGSDLANPVVLVLDQGEYEDGGWDAGVLHPAAEAMIELWEKVE